MTAPPRAVVIGRLEKIKKLFFRAFKKAPSLASDGAFLSYSDFFSSAILWLSAFGQSHPSSGLPWSAQPSVEQVPSTSETP